MSKKRIPVRVIHTAEKGYSVEIYVQAKELNASLPADQILKHAQGVWTELRSFGHNLSKAWAHRNKELASLGYL